MSKKEVLIKRIYAIEDCLIDKDTNNIPYINELYKKFANTTYPLPKNIEVYKLEALFDALVKYFKENK